MPTLIINSVAGLQPAVLPTEPIDSGRGRCPGLDCFRLSAYGFIMNRYGLAVRIKIGPKVYAIDDIQR